MANKNTYAWLKEELGANDDEVTALKEGIKEVESSGGEFNVAGGFNNQYDGVYQLGKMAKHTVENMLKLPLSDHKDDDRALFREDKDRQEMYFEAHTISNLKALKKNSIFKKASKAEQLALLGYAHNRGAGATIKDLNSGLDLSKLNNADAFGTKPEKYITSIMKRLNQEPKTNFTGTEVPELPSEPINPSDSMGPMEVGSPTIHAPFYPTENQSTFGGTEFKNTTMLEEIRDITLDGFGKDLGNKLLDKNALGFILQNVILRSQETDTIDTNYDPLKEPEVYKEATSGLDNEQLKELLNEHGYNRHNFILAASAMKGQNQRRQEINNYTQEHPVLSGVTSVASIVGEAVAFAPLTAVTSASAMAMAGTNIARFGTLGRAGIHLAGNLVEQGVQEVIWAKNDNKYEFDPILFGFGLLVGTGIQSKLHNEHLDKYLRSVLSNEDGFIKAVNGASLVDEVATRVKDDSAIAFAQRFEDLKRHETASLAQQLMEEPKRAREILDTLNNELKFADPTDDYYKIVKSERQKMIRKIKRLDANFNAELKTVIDGTHPKLTAKLNPKLDAKEIAKELGIPVKTVNSPEKLRKFLGIDTPDIASEFVIEGEEAFVQVLNKQLEELKNSKRLNANETLKSLGEKLGDNFIGNALYDLASTDGVVSRYLFNKGNLVSSENPHIAGFYNFMAPDNMGRTSKSKIRALESQQKYSNIFGGELMETFHGHGDSLYAYMKGTEEGIKSKLLSNLNFDDYEKTVTNMFKKRLVMGKEEFLRYVKDPEIARHADEFADSFNAANKKILDRAKQLGVEGVDFNATEDWFHRSWDFTKARAVDEKALTESIFLGMKKYISTKNLQVTDDVLKAEAKKFAFGIRNADITVIEGANESYIEFLSKLAKKTESQEAQGVILDEATRLQKNLDKAKANDLSARVHMNVDIPISGTDLKLSDLLEDNFINTQKRYNSRMAARIAAAEHGIKDINQLDKWVDAAVDMEIKRLAKSGEINPAQKAKFVEQAMRQDVQSFKNGSMTGLGDLTDDKASDILRFTKKYNYAALMQYTGISSIAELGGTIAEVGVGTVLEELKKNIIPFYKRNILKQKGRFVDELYNDLRSFTGIGMEDYAFSSRGTSAGNRIYKDGLLSQVESGVDVLGRTTQGVFGGIETLGRKVTANSLAIQWADHFKDIKKRDGILSAFLGGRKKISNRVLENVGLGEFSETGDFIFSPKYESIKKEFLSKAKFDERGNLVNINLSEWDTELAHSFGDVIVSQSNHIFVNPDATTLALWQTSTVGQILNQFRTFSINAASKVAGHSVANAAMGLKRGDYTEMYKFGSKLFWGTTMGTLSIMIRDNIRSVGDGQGVNMGIFDEGAMKAAAIGLSRSSIVGQVPTLVDTVGNAFGAEPFFEKTSSVGRSRNFFNLATTPTGQAVSKNFKGVTDIATGEFSKGSMRIMKASPFYRQMGAQQLFNFIERED